VPAPARRLLLTLLFALPPALLLSLGLGAVGLGPGEVVRGLLQGLRGELDTQAAVIVSQIRLPRALLAAAVGCILALCGAVTQGLFRNPLADPSLIGVTGGAALGAALCMVAGTALLGSATGITAALPPGLGDMALVSVGAFVGGAAAVLLVYRLATGSTGTSVATLLLAGLAVTALAGALISLLEFYADNTLLRRISLWKQGALEVRSSGELWLAMATALLLAGALPRHAEALNALLLGESEAGHLGVDVARLKRALVAWVALGMAIAVAVAGTIAFVGLVVPHMVRLLIGPDHRYLLPASALCGALLLILADVCARMLAAPAEIPVGILTALLGVPFFIALLRQRGHYALTTT